MYLYTRPQCKAGFLLLYRYFFSFYLRFIAAAVSEPEASELGSSLIGKKSHYRGLESLFLAKRNSKW